MSYFAKLLISILLSISATNSIAHNFFAINPIGLGLTVGQWLIKNSQRMYFLQVEASGQNYEQAKEEGLRFAVNQAVGTVVMRETQVKNHEMLRNDITLYSAGYIDEYKVISEESLDGKTKLVMNVWVAESKIANRLFVLSNVGGVIDGEKASSQYKSALEERIHGDRLLDAVGKDFPEKSFVINMGQPHWRMVSRDVEILLPVEISWSREYLDAMHEVLVRTRNGADAANQRYARAWPSVISLKRPSDWLTTYAAYADVKKADSLRERMVSTKPSIQINIKNAVGDAIYSVCESIPYFSGAFFGESLAFGIYARERYGYPTGQFFASDTPDADFSIYGDFKINTTFSLPIRSSKSQLLNSMERIEVMVVSQAQCEKQKSQVI